MRTDFHHEHLALQRLGDVDHFLDDVVGILVLHHAVQSTVRSETKHSNMSVTSCIARKRDTTSPLQQGVHLCKDYLVSGGWFAVREFEESLEGGVYRFVNMRHKSILSCCSGEELSSFYCTLFAEPGAHCRVLVVLAITCIIVNGQLDKPTVHVIPLPPLLPIPAWKEFFYLGGLPEVFIKRFSEGFQIEYVAV